MTTNSYTQLVQAKKVLELPEHATMETIKGNYRTLLLKWHPDTSREPKAMCEEMTRKITIAYQIILQYVHQYPYSFEDEDLKQYESDEEWWYNRFGKDPVWQG